MRLLWLFALLIWGIGSEAAPYKILFIGNSYTYLSSDIGTNRPTEKNPIVPKILKAIIQAKHPELKVQTVFNTLGRYSFIKHYHNARTRKLIGEQYDAVVLQGYSIEALKLPPWFAEHDIPNRPDFLEYGKKLIELSPVSRDKIFLFATWAYNIGHPFFAKDFAGGDWYDNDWFSITPKIEKGYEQLAKETGTNVVPVGRMWSEVEDDHSSVVTHDDLYLELKTDFSHASYKGSYLAALTLYRKIFNESVTGSPFDPLGMTNSQAEYLQALVDKQALR